MENKNLKLFEIELQHNPSRDKWVGQLGDLVIAVYPGIYTAEKYPHMSVEVREKIQIERRYRAKMSVVSDERTFGEQLTGRTITAVFGTSPEHAIENLEGRLQFFNDNINKALGAKKEG